MAEVRHLNNAPITEAIIDFRVKLPSEFKVEAFLQLKKTISDRFPKFEERKLFSSQLRIKKGEPQPPSAEYHGVHGYFFRPEDDKTVVQFRIDGFTFSRLKPYTYWEEMFGEARELWGMYSEIAQPEAVTRLAVRYINHINIPLPVDDLSEYFTASPKTPDNIQGVISGFLSKVVVYDQEMDVSTNIVQALEKSIKPDKHITVVLDIDSFKTGDFNVSNGEMWDIFTNLHNLKNQVFFNSITDETARLFE
jgi:uncharacterized protein (TIGR04255 family)